MPGKMEEKIIKPILLDEHGNTLCCYPGTDMRDPETYVLALCIGSHDHCGGFVDIRRVSEEFSALACRMCNLQVYIPSNVTTWAELWEWAVAMKHKPFTPKPVDTKRET